MKTTLSRNAIFLATAISLVALAPGQHAEIPRGPDSRAVAKAELLKRYDKDKDGKLGKDEIAAIARDRMLANDLNKDGRVDQVELKKMREKARQMPKMDAAERAMAREQDKVNAQIQAAAREAAEKKAAEGATASEGSAE